MSSEAERELVPYGWAPGNYMIHCMDCPDGRPPREDNFGDKRCSRCRKHAIAERDRRAALPPRETPQAGQVWRHFKGGVYEIIDPAVHTETMEILILYRATVGSRMIWARPARMFNQEVSKGVFRFTRVT